MPVNSPGNTYSTKRVPSAIYLHFIPLSRELSGGSRSPHRTTNCSRHHRPQRLLRRGAQRKSWCRARAANTSSPPVPPALAHPPVHPQGSLRPSQIRGGGRVWYLQQADLPPPHQGKGGGSSARFFHHPGLYVAGSVPAVRFLLPPSPFRSSHMTKTSAILHSGARPGTASPSLGSRHFSKFSLNSSIYGCGDCRI